MLYKALQLYIYEQLKLWEDATKMLLLKGPLRVPCSV